MNDYHVPVMVAEVLEYLEPARGGTFVDATVGGGGHAEALLEHGPGLHLVGLDRDGDAIAASRRRLARFGSRVTLVQSDYRRLGEVLEQLGICGLAGVLLDLGVSSHQLDTPERGFSYQHQAPLDMRMDPSQPLTAAGLVNSASEQELASIIGTLGEERWARRIARFLVARREVAPLETTQDLVEVIKAAIPAAARREGLHPARRTFQALRIAVNRELEGLDRALEGAIDALVPGGRICVLAFHSLEDRAVKTVFRKRAGACSCPPGLPVCACGARRDLTILTPRARQARHEEVAANPRARSVRLRAAEKSTGF
ncbi:MAG: 16S rRNA (cytosine(1402)-N(4))-methyltransferase RsmH [Bacillota bacterium]